MFLGRVKKFQILDDLWRCYPATLRQQLAKGLRLDLTQQSHERTLALNEVNVPIPASCCYQCHCASTDCELSLQICHCRKWKNSSDRPARLHVSAKQEKPQRKPLLNMLIVVEWLLLGQSYDDHMQSRLDHKPSMAIQILHCILFILVPINFTHISGRDAIGATSSAVHPKEHLLHLKHPNIWTYKCNGTRKTTVCIPSKGFQLFPEIMAFAGKYWWKLDTALPIELHPPPFPMVDRRADASAVLVRQEISTVITSSLL